MKFALLHVVPGPAPVIRVRFVRVSGRSKRRALSRVVFPEGHVDQGEAASGEHGGAVVPLVPRFPCPAVRVMLLRLVLEQPFQWEAATTPEKSVARLFYIEDGGATAARKGGCREAWMLLSRRSSFQAYLLNKIRLDPVPSSEGGRDYSEIPSIPRPKLITPSLEEEGG